MARRRPGSVNPLQTIRWLRGKTFCVTSSPSEAVASAAAHAREHGFQDVPFDLNPYLQAESSPWECHVLEIGDTSRSWWTGALLDVAPVLSFIPGLRPVVPPTYLVCAARIQGTDRTEIEIMPVMQHKGDPASAPAAATFVDRTLEDFRTAHERAGTLVEVGKSSHFTDNRDSPAFPKKLKALVKHAKGV